MPTLEERKAAFDKLQKRHAKVKTAKDQLMGELESKKRELVQLGEEIRAANLDPKKLKAHKEQLEGEIDDLTKSIEKDLTEVENAIKQFQGSNSRSEDT